MPIINQVVSGGGSGPERYLELGKDANNYLVKAGTTMVNLTGITGISANVLEGAYTNSSQLSGSVDLSNIVTIKNKGMNKCFTNCPNITSVNISALTTVEDYGMNECFEGCTGITNSTIDFSNLTSLGTYGMYNAFKGCSNLVTTNLDFSSLPSIGLYGLQNAFTNCSGITGTVDLSSLTSVLEYGLYETFKGCSGITSFDLSSFSTVINHYSFYGAFNSCSGLTTANLSSVSTIAGNQSCRYMFQNCTGLTSANLSNLIAITGSSSCQFMFKGCSNLTTVNSSSLKNIAGGYCCSNMFEDCSSLSSFDVSKVTSIAPNSCSEMFKNCTSLTELSFDSLVITNVNFDNAFQNTLSGVTGCTVHFPSSWQSTMSSWPNIINGMGGTNTTILFDLPPVTVVDLSDVVAVTAQNQYYQAFNGNTAITGFNLDNLKIVSGYSGCQQMFQNCTSITQANFPKLEIINNWAGLAEVCRYGSAVSSFNLDKLTQASASYVMSHTFDGCDITGDVSFKSLYITYGSEPFQGCFTNCTNLTSVSFPALRDTATGNSHFKLMLSGVTGCTVHFPSNLSNKNINCGGTNTTILYDLPATVILTGANTVKYERNPIDDTGTALAWRKYEYDSSGFVVDWTSYYTSGLTDPSVSDAIYSDAACTQSVTTITAIA